MSAADRTATLDGAGAPATASTVSAERPVVRAEPALAEGDCIGRYTVREPIGAGGMGEVFAAHDPELDRVVAVKVMRGDQAGHSPEARARFQREAQAMARLNHPNVVAVFDVGDLGDGVFVAMELVSGPTLRAWLDERTRPWREVVKVFLQAGRGLEAAHRAGIVHRDFKPANVIVGDRVRVADFGLARAADDLAVHSFEIESPLAGEVTRTGHAIGTPAYMAPEQRGGAPVSPLSDQYSFAVALYEGLTGARPGDPPPEGPPRTVPGWLRAVAERGLSSQPEDRYPSMTALLADLARDPDRTRRRILAAAAVVAVVAGALVARRALATPPCSTSAARLAGIWDPAHERAVAEAFAATRAPFAGDAARAVASRLDAYAAAWTAMHVDACRATAVHHEQSEAVLDLRMRCLGARRDALRELGGLLAGADAVVVQHAVEAVAALPPVADCADVERLAAVLPLPADPARRAAIEKVRADLAAAVALTSAARYDDALARLEPLAVEARATGYAPVIAEALLALARAEHAAGRPGDQAEANFMAAGVAAESGRHDEVKAAAWTKLVAVTGVWSGRFADAHRWAELADAAVTRLGDPPVARGRLLEELGDVLDRESRLDEALARHQEALALYQRAGADDTEIAPLYVSIAEDLDSLGRHDEALAAAEEATARYARAYGANHPLMGGPLDTAASALWQLGRLPEAEERYRRALDAYRRGLGDDNIKVAVVLNNLAMVLDDAKRYEEATVALERGLAIEEKTFGPRHASVAHTLDSLGVVAGHRGDRAAGRRFHERALAMREELLGPDHPEVADSLVNLGAMANQEERYADAVQLQERAARIYEKALGPDHPRVALALGNLAANQHALGRHADAAANAARAAAIYDKLPQADTDLRVQVLWTLAISEYSAGHPTEVARACERGLAILEAAGQGDTESAYDFLAGLGLARLDSGHPAEAIAPLERAVALQPDSQKTKALLAKARRAMK